MSEVLKATTNVGSFSRLESREVLPDGGVCRKKSEGSVEDSAFSSPLAPFLLTSGSADKRICSLYRPDLNALFPAHSVKEAQQLRESEEAAKAEKRGQKADAAASRLTHFQTALANYQKAGDAEGAKRVLCEIQKAYESLDNGLSAEKTKAEIAVLDGRLDEALKGFRAVEKVLLSHDIGLEKEALKAALVELNLKISATLQAMASKIHQEASEDYQKAVKTRDTEAAAEAVGKYDKALGIMKEALWRTPSRPLTAGTLSLLVEAREAALRTTTTLDLQVAMLKGKGERCRSNCHEGDPTPAFPFQTATDPSKEEKDGLFLNYKEGLLGNLRSQSTRFLKEIPAVVETGLGTPSDVDERIYGAKILAEAYVAVGEFSKAESSYKILIADLHDIWEFEGDSVEKKKLILKVVDANHQLASVHLHEYQLGKGANHGAPVELARKAADILYKNEKALNALDVTAFGDAETTRVLKRTREFLRVQNGLMSAEVTYASARDVDGLGSAEALLNNAVAGEEAYIKNVEKLEPGDPLSVLFAKAHERLAQLYYRGIL